MNRRILFTTLAVLPMLSFAPAAHARPVVTLNATKGLTPEIKETYRRAVLGAGPHVRVKIRLFINARLGADFGELYIPRARRFQHVTIQIYVLRGKTLREPVTVNMLQLSNRSVLNRLQQVTTIK